MRDRYKFGLIFAISLPAAPCLAAETPLVGSGFSWSNINWQPITGINDPRESGITPKLDFVGDANNWGGYWAKDANYVYVRARVGVGTVSSGTYSDSLLVLINAPITAYPNRPTLDYGFAWDSKSGNNTSHGLEMVFPAVNDNQWGQLRMDDLDGTSGQKGSNDINGGGRTTDGYVRAIDNVTAAGSSVGATSFIDFAVSRTYLDTYTQLKKADGLDWKITFASIQNATDHNQLNADVAGGASLSDQLTKGWSQSLTAATIALTEPRSATVIRGGTGTLGVTVDNSAPSGYNKLVYTVTAPPVAGVTLGDATPVPASLGPDGMPVAHTLTAGTNGSTGFGQIPVTITVSDPNASNPTQTSSSILTVLDHSNAEFANVTGAASKTIGTNSLILDFGTVRQGANGGSLASSFDVVALQSTLTSLTYTAGLDLDWINSTGDTAKLFKQSGVSSFTNLAAGDTQGFTFDFNTSEVGTYSSTYQFHFSDQDLPGATAAGSEVLTLTLRGQVVPVPEPTSLGLLAVFGGPLLLKRRRGR